jgi:hypothetical protein
VACDVVSAKFGIKPGFEANFQLRLRKNREVHNLQCHDVQDHIYSMQESQMIKEIELLKQNPETVLKAKNEIDENEIVQFLTRHIKTNMGESKERPSYIFDKDISRGITFTRKDLTNKIADKNPIPFKDLESSLKVEMGMAALAELTQKSEDKCWEGILQASVTQTSLTALLNSLKGVFLQNISSQTWFDGNECQSLVLDFGENIPPIQLEIIRNEHTSEIQQVKVEVIAIGDILKRTSGDEIGGKVMISPAVVAKLNYSITLSEESKEPIIQNLSIDLASS